MAGPVTSERKLRSSSQSSDVEIVKIKHTTPFYGQKFIEEVNKKKKSLMDSDIKTKYKQQFENYPNSNPAVIWRRIENLEMNDQLLFAMTLILKVRCIERLFRYMFRYDDTFIINSHESDNAIGSEFTPQDMLDTLKPMCIPVRQAISWVRCENRSKDPREHRLQR